MRTRTLLPAVLAIVSMFGAFSAPAHAVTGKQATKIALAKFKPDFKRAHNVAVFGLGHPLAAKQSVIDAALPSGKDRVEQKLSKIGRRAWLFWEDPYYAERFEHPSRLLLIDAASGKIIRDMRLRLWPLVDAKEPAFIAKRGPADRRYRVFTRFNKRDAEFLNASPKEIAKITEALTPSQAYAADCLISLADDKGKSDQQRFNEFWRSRGVAVYDETNIPQKDNEFPSSPNGEDVEDLVKTLPAKCKDVILYMNGEGSETEGITVSEHERKVGNETTRVEKTFSFVDWKLILKNNPGRKFKLVVDGCHSGKYTEVSKGVANALVTVTATGSGKVALTPGYGPDTFTRVLIRSMEGAEDQALQEDPATGVDTAARLLDLATDSNVFQRIVRTVLRAHILAFLFIAPAPTRTVNLTPYNQVPPPPPGPPPPPPEPTPGNEPPPTIKPIQAEFVEGVFYTQYSVTVEASPGRAIDYAWSLTPPPDDATCKKFEQQAAPRYARWYHGSADGCSHTGTEHNGDVKVVATVHWPDVGRDWVCTATYHGTLTGIGPQPEPCVAKTP